jgi:hypothetical protein
VSRRLTCGPSPRVRSPWAPGGPRRREPSPGRSMGASTPTGSPGSALSHPPLLPEYQSSPSPSLVLSTEQSRYLNGNGVKSAFEVVKEV